MELHGEIMLTRDKLYREETIGDGSCLIHAILYCIDEKYRNSTTNEKRSQANEIRRGIFESVTPKAFQKYEFQNDFPSIQDFVETMVNPTEYIDYNYIPYIESRVGYNIFLIGYIQGEFMIPIPLLHNTIREKRKSILVYYNGVNHFEAVSLNHEETVFDPSHYLIQQLMQKYKSKFANTIFIEPKKTLKKKNTTKKTKKRKLKKNTQAVATNETSESAVKEATKEEKIARLSERWVGVSVQKYFKKVLFNGRITEIWIDSSERPQAQITYEDGDVEDLELWDALEIVKSPKKRQELEKDVEAVFSLFPK
jgi:hypothetical protein